MSEARPLQLLAEDEGDLAVLSAALQDAVAKVGDIAFEPRSRRLTIVFNRYRWEAGVRQRVRSALQLGGVMQVQTRKIRRDRPDGVVELLAIGFQPEEAPGGTLTLSFAGGGDLRARVECVDAVLADVSAPWPTPRTPSHEA
ncbi:DUF2948 family protein [Phenylobacterium kunshanense]|uniref:DUF2948 domain-containing protein n=1 Tax=Phenylobacterium kunshanense TaxID=1445034 RepID=A0A328B7B9_9CAUL|nr:DUF2948 family protein [Phenylobacterium kunshanense]RAK63013.1 DUF2948 domain-containing protein [Phenylobacterium kunshanense]